MKPLTAALLNISVSLVFAALMMLTRYIFEGSPYKDEIVHWLIAAWFIPFSFFSAAAVGKARSRCC